MKQRCGSNDRHRETGRQLRNSCLLVSSASGHVVYVRRSLVHSQIAMRVVVIRHLMLRRLLQDAAGYYKVERIYVQHEKPGVRHFSIPTIPCAALDRHRPFSRRDA